MSLECRAIKKPTLYILCPRVPHSRGSSIVLSPIVAMTTRRGVAIFVTIQAVAAMATLPVAMLTACVAMETGAFCIT